jgi:ABC-type nitrate/sulfonate/bicarbonate transport system ATPase subunit
VSKRYVERRRRRRHVEQVTVEGEELEVLRDMSFEVYPGELIMILGHSGCGKSTLLNIVAGFATPSRGQVLIGGKPVEGPDPKRMFIFQESSLFPWKTVRENLEVAARTGGMEQSLQKVDEYLRMVGLEDFAGHYPHEISGGMARLAELARALVMDPDVLFMDEPFSALDFMTRCLMREEMLNLMAIFKKTILFITHDIDEAIQLGDRVFILSDRPAHFKAVFELSQPHPRDISTGEVGEIRRQTYMHMGVNPII